MTTVARLLSWLLILASLEAAYIVAAPLYSISIVFAGVVSFAITNTAFAILEVFEREPGTASRYSEAVLLWLAYTVSAMLAWHVGVYIIAMLGLKTLVSVETVNAWWVLGPFAFLFVTVFFYYWFHRFSHQVPVLWRFHAVHHALNPVNSWNSYHHLAEEFMKVFAVTLPLALLIPFPTEHIIIFSGIAAAWGQWVHSSSRSLVIPRLLRPLFADNLYHHHHHSSRPEDFDKNYAAFFPIWDYIFGTQNMPKTEEFPPVGLGNIPPTKGFIDYATRPFRSPGRS